MSADTGGIGDTTGRTAADEALRRSEARFRQVLEATPNALVMINREGLIEMVNGQAERMFGHSRAELLGSPVEMLVPERFRAAIPNTAQGSTLTPIEADGHGSRPVRAAQGWQ